MKQIELTSKLVLAIIGLTSVGAILVPTYAVPTIKSADIFDGEVKTADIANNAVTSPKIQNGQVSTDDLASNAVTTGKIADGAIQAGDIAAGVIPSGGGALPNVHTEIESVSIAPNSFGSLSVQCPDGEKLTGGGFNQNLGIDVLSSYPGSDGATWFASGQNTNNIERDLVGIAVCMGPSQ